jgi:hypothetical protein
LICLDQNRLQWGAAVNVEMKRWTADNILTGCVTSSFSAWSLLQEGEKSLQIHIYIYTDLFLFEGKGLKILKNTCFLLLKFL